MKIYDISQEIFTCEVYPGDPAPTSQRLNSMEKGDLYNLTAFSMCAHNGTHVDAPFHFINEGKTIDKMPLEAFVGPAYVAEHNGEMSAQDAREILSQAHNDKGDPIKRIIIKGQSIVSLEAAKVFSEAGIHLLGVESQSVGPIDAPMAVHKELLNNEIVLLEGLRLDNVPKGVYLLSAAPLNLSGSDGAPCRAVLIDF